MLTDFKFAALLGAIILASSPAPAQFHSPQIKHDKKQHEDVEWLWQYSPSATDPQGRENALIQDPSFRPFLARYVTAPQAFWGPDNTPIRRSLADTALDFLSVPGKVLADEDRYLTITGCVFRFCPNRGLLFVDLNLPHPLVVFAAIDWIKDSHTTDQPEAEYTLWIFPNHAFPPLEPATTPGAPPPALSAPKGLDSQASDSTTPRIPPALLRSLTRWTAEPLPGSGIVERITHTILVDPDGTPHPIPNLTAPAKPAPAAKSEGAKSQ